MPACPSPSGRVDIRDVGRRATQTLRGRMATRRHQRPFCRLHRLLHGRDREQAGAGLRAQQDSRDRPRSRNRRLLSPETPHRHETNLHGHRLLRIVQPGQRRAGSTSARTRSNASPQLGSQLEGRSLDVDAIVFAIGFDAITGALTESTSPGSEGCARGALAARAAHVPGAAVPPGFPNLFMVTGPGSPSVLSNMVVSIEQHVDWITDCIAHLRELGLDRIEAEPRPRSSGWSTWRTSLRAPFTPRPLVVRRRQHPRQTAGVHALCRRLWPVPPRSPRGRPPWLRRLRPGRPASHTEEVTHDYRASSGQTRPRRHLSAAAPAPSSSAAATPTG